MVRDHVYADVDGHDHAPELDGCGFGTLRAATIFKDAEAARSSDSGTSGANTGNAELVGTCSNCSGDNDAGSIGASPNDAVEVARTAPRKYRLQSVMLGVGKNQNHTG